MKRSDQTRQAGAYGENLSSRFGLATAPSFVARALPKTEIAVTEIRCDVVNNGLSAPIPREDAFLLTLQVRDCPAHDLWIDGRPQATAGLKSGSYSLYDLRQSPVVNSISAFHNLHFYMPRSALDSIAEADGQLPVKDVPHRPGEGAHDPVVQGLGFALLPAFERPEEANPLFVSHVTLAIASYLVRIAGDAGPAQALELTDAQEREVKALMDANLDGTISILTLAETARLPPSAFPGAFKRKTGVSPHRWLLQRRIDLALNLLRHRGLSLGEVAVHCGFVDERHLVRVLDRAARLKRDVLVH